MKKCKEFSRSGSDSGVSCDGTKSPVNSEKNVELLAAPDKKMKTLNNGEENKTMEESQGLEHGKLVNIEHLSVPATKRDHVKSASRGPGRKSNTVITKCLVENTDDWNKFMLGKSKNKSRSKTIKVTSSIKEEKSIPNVKENFESTNVLDEKCPKGETKVTLENINPSTCDKVVEKQIKDSKITSKGKTPKIKQIKTVTSQKQYLDPTLKHSDVDFSRPRKSNDKKLSKNISKDLDSSVNGEVSQGSILPSNELTTVKHLINEDKSVNSEEKIKNFPRRKHRRKCSDCNDKTCALPEHNEAQGPVSKRKRKISDPSKKGTHDNIEQEVQKNIKTPSKTRASTLESPVGEVKEDIRNTTHAKQRLSFSDATSNEKINEPQSICNDKCAMTENNEAQGHVSKRKRKISDPIRKRTHDNIEQDVVQNIKSPTKTIEKIKSSVGEVEDTGITTRAKLSLSDATSNEKINVIEPQSNLTLKTSDIKEANITTEIQSPQSKDKHCNNKPSTRSSESQINEHLELQSPKSKRSKRQTPQKTEKLTNPVIEPQSNLSLKTSDIKEANITTEIQSPQSKDKHCSDKPSTRSSESQINEHLELQSPKSKRSKRQTPQKTEKLANPVIEPQSNVDALITSDVKEANNSAEIKSFQSISGSQVNESAEFTNSDIDQTNNSLETPLNIDKNNCDVESARITELQSKYASLLNCNLNPTVNIVRLKQFSENQWISKNKKSMCKVTQSDPDQNLTTQCGTMDVSKIKTEAVSPLRNSNSVVLRDVRIVLEDIRRGKQHRKIIKLNRNFNLTKIETRSKRFQYKYKADLIPITSRNGLFHEAELTEGFSFQSPLLTPLFLEQIPKHDNDISMLNSPEENIQCKINNEDNTEPNDVIIATEPVDRLDETDQIKYGPKSMNIESGNIIKLPEITPSKIFNESINLSKVNESCPTHVDEDKIKFKTSKEKKDLLKSKIRVKLPDKLFKNYEKKVEEKRATPLKKSLMENDQIEKEKKDNAHDISKTKTVSCVNKIPVKLPLQLFKEHEKNIGKQKEISAETSTNNIEEQNKVKRIETEKSTVEGNKTDKNIPEQSSVKHDNNTTPGKTSTENHVSDNTPVTNDLSTDNKIKSNEKIVRTSSEKIKSKHTHKYIKHKVIHQKHENQDEKATLRADNTNKQNLSSKKQLSTENNDNILIKTDTTPKHVDENLFECLISTKDLSSKQDLSTVGCTNDNALYKTILNQAELIQTEPSILNESGEKESQTSEIEETTPIEQISCENTTDPAVNNITSELENIFGTTEQNSNVSEDSDSSNQNSDNVGTVTPAKRSSTETTITVCSTTSQKPKHIFKFAGTSDIKRPPTRKGKVKLNRPTSSQDVFKVPAAFSPLSHSQRSNSSTQSSPKKISPQKANTNSTVFPKKSEREIDTISIYAETIGADSVTDVASVTNNSSDDSDDNFSDIFNILPEPIKHTDLNEWVDSTIKYGEKLNSPLLDKTPLPAENVANNLSLEQEKKVVSLNTISSDFSIGKETETNSTPIITLYNKHLTTHSYNNTSQCSRSSDVTRAIDIFKAVCINFLKNGECKIKPCNYNHEYPANWNMEIDKLSTEAMLALYDFAKENKAEHLYKHIFSPITEHIGNKRDFNTLIRMVKDVIEMDINSDRSPYITIIIDTLCKTGVTFNSIVEFVYKNANVGPRYINLLSDILINLIVDRGDCDGNWITIRELLKNINYALDDGIFRAIIVECLQKVFPKRELFLKVYHDLVKHIADKKLTNLNETILNNFYNRLLKFKLNTEADEYYERCQALNITLGNKSDHSNSPASSVANSPATKSVTKVSPFQAKKTDNTQEKASPKTPLTKNTFNPTKPQLSQIAHSTPKSYNYSGGPKTAPKKFTTPPPAAPTATTANFNPVPPLIPNLPLLYDRPTPSYIPNNFTVPPPPIYNRPNIPLQPSKQQTRLVADSRFTNKTLNSTHSRNTLSSSASFPPVSPTYSPQIYCEVRNAVAQENISLLFSLIVKYKDNDLTDIFIKTAVEAILEHNHNYPTFYMKLCQTAKLFSTMEEPTLAYVLKTIGLNMLLFLTKKSKWDPAYLMYNIIKLHFKDLNDIVNVKLYLSEKYSYFKRILIIIEMHIKKFKFETAWNMLKDHIFQCNIWKGENNELEIHRNTILKELLASIVQKKLWRLGLHIVQHIIKNNILNIDLKLHINEIFLQAINNKCEINVILEFEKCSPCWYNYISDVIFRSILTHTVSLHDFSLAKRFYQIGRHFDVYPDLCGNEILLPFKMCFVFEEIWLIFEIFFENMIRFYPIQSNIFLKVEDGTRTPPTEDLPINLQQFGITTAVIQTRITNILNNYIKPAVKIITQNNSIFLNADSVNKHLEHRMQS